jgi:hypothetical protein
MARDIKFPTAKVVAACEAAIRHHTLKHAACSIFVKPLHTREIMRAEKLLAGVRTEGSHLHEVSQHDAEWLDGWL